MPALLPALLAGPAIRIIAILVLVVVVFTVADFGGLIDTIWFEAEQLLQGLLSPF